MTDFENPRPAVNDLLARREQARKRLRRKRLLLDLKYGSLLAAFVVVVVGLIGFNFYWEFGGPARNAAIATAEHDGGLTSVTSTSYSWFSFCRSEMVGFHVTGYRDGQKVTVTACVHPLGLFNYVR